MGLYRNGARGCSARSIILAGAALGLPACTTQLSSQLDPEVATATYGQPYRLPMRQFDIEVTWQLVRCPNPKAAERSERAPEFAVSAAYTPHIVEGESRIIDYREITNRFKTGEIKIDYHPGTMLVKSINSTITGKEAEALSGALKLGLNVARIAFGLGPSGTGIAATEGTPLPISCISGAQDAIDALEIAQSRIKAIPAEAERLADRIAVLRLRAVSGGLSGDDRAELTKLETASDTLARDFDTLTANARRLRTRLSYTESWRFPDRSVGQSEGFAANKAALDKWLGRLLTGGSFNPEQFAISARFTPLLGEATCPRQGCAKIDTAGGFVFRQPVQARLEVVATESAEALIDEVESAPQFGRLRVLPLRSRWGENNTLVASFAADGLPQSIEYKSTEAAGVKLVGSAGEAAENYLTIRDEIRAAEAEREAVEAAGLQAAANAPVTELKRQIEELELKAKLARLRAQSSPELDAIEAEIAMLRLQKEKRELQQADTSK